MTKKIFIKSLCSFFLLMLSGTMLLGQGDYRCYRIAVDEGLSSMQKKEFGQAIQQFTAAYSCEYTAGADSLNLLINQSTEALNLAKAKAEASEQFEREQKEKQAELKAQAEKERDEKEAALKREEQAKSEAVKQGERAESRRLIELADKKPDNCSYYEALVMTLSGMELGGPDVYSNGMRTFGKLVRDSFSEVIHSSDATFDELLVLPRKDKLLAIGAQKITVLDANSFKVNNSFQPQFEKTSDYCFAPISNEFLFWSEANIHRFKIDGSPYFPISNHTDEILFATFSSDEKYFITCSRDKTAALQPIGRDTLPMILSGHNSPVYEAEFSPDNNYVLTRSSDGLVIIWNVAGEKLAQLGGEEIYIYDADFNASSNRVVTASANGNVKVWDLKGNELLAFDEHKKAVRQVVCLSNPETVLTRSVNTIKAWDEKGNKLIMANSIPKVKGMSINHKKDGALIWGSQHSLNWINQDLSELRIFKGLETDVVAATFSSDDAFVLTSAKDYSTQLWDQSGQLLISWPSVYRYPLSAVFSVNNQYVFILSNNRKEIIRCPMTPNIYAQMKADSEKMNDAIARIKEKYELEFLKSFGD